MSARNRRAVVEIDLHDYISDFETDELLDELAYRGVKWDGGPALVSQLVEELRECWRSGDSQHFNVVLDRLEEMAK